MDRWTQMMMYVRTLDESYGEAMNGWMDEQSHKWLNNSFVKRRMKWSLEDGQTYKRMK